MRFMLMIHGLQGENIPPADLPGVVAQHMKLVEDLKAAGAMVSHGRLTHTSTARTLRADAAGVTVHDGPFPETREQLAGYYLIEAPDIEAALAWARYLPIMPGSGVEVRALAHGE